MKIINLDKHGNEINLSETKLPEEFQIKIIKLFNASKKNKEKSRELEKEVEMYGT